MSECNPSIGSFTAVKSDLNIVPKFKELMTEVLAEGSIYERAKDTMYYQFKDLQLTEKEKASISSEFMQSLTASLTSTAMQTAMEWEKEERDGAYTLAKIKADTEVALAQKEKVKADICLTEKQTELQSANITATLSKSIRENGYVTVYEADGYTPKTMDSTGLLYNQTKQVEAATYQLQADTYRKSGVVHVGSDGYPVPNPNWVDDGNGTTPDANGEPQYLTTSSKVPIGLSGDDNGYTNQQSKNAERQRQSYEDSKINHMLNSLAVVYGQVLSAEEKTPDWITNYVKSGMARLLTTSSQTQTPWDGEGPMTDPNAPK